MKKVILSLFVALMMTGLAFADATNTTATNSRNASQQQNINTISGIADLSSGNTVEVDGRGSLSILEYVKKKATTSGKDAALVSNACRVIGLHVSGNGSATGDHVEIYDAASATGTPVLEVSIGTAGETVSFSFPGGIPFSTGVYADLSALNSLLVTVVYDE